MVIAETDPDARTVQLLRTHSIDQLRHEAVDDPNARRALRHTATAAARSTIHSPTEAILERFGPRPNPTSPTGTPWDEVVTRLAEHHVVHGTSIDRVGEGRDHARLIAAIDRLDHLQAAEAGITVRDLAEQIHATEARMPIDEHELRDLTAQLDTYIEKAIANPADYVTDLLGSRPSEDHEVISHLNAGIPLRPRSRPTVTDPVSRRSMDHSWETPRSSEPSAPSPTLSTR